MLRAFRVFRMFRVFRAFRAFRVQGWGLGVREFGWFS